GDASRKRLAPTGSCPPAWIVVTGRHATPAPFRERYRSLRRPAAHRPRPPEGRGARLETTFGRVRLDAVRTTVAGLLLAAGEGSRFGQPKALVELNGQTLAERGVGLLR